MLDLGTLSHFIEINNLIEKHDKIVLGVSGGADSICLLHTLNALKKALEIRLFVVHINHGIRGEEAKRDEEFVREFCNKLNVEFFGFEYNIPEMAREWKLSEEEAGRKARYEAFERIAKDIEKEGDNIKIAVAHNKNDNAETVLHNLSRGSGITGLKGIGAGNGRIIRPLIGFDRFEIEEYLNRNNITYMTDSTNLENEYTRNVLRNEVFPILKKDVNHNVINNFYKSSRIIAEADEYFESKAEEFCRLNLKKTDEGSYLLNKETLTNKPHIIATYIIRYCLREVMKDGGYGIKDIGMIHIEDVLSLMKSENGKKIDLKYSIKVYNEYKYIRFAKEINKNAQNKVGFGFKVRYNILNKFDIQNIPGEKNRKWLDFDKVTEIIVEYYSMSWRINTNFCEDPGAEFFEKNIELRHRETGDFIHISNGKKSIKKLLTDEKIPAILRDEYIVLAIGKNVLWILKYPDILNDENAMSRISSLCKVKESTKRVLEISIV